MSHAATNWAIGQRGLKPAAKLVLWHLADHHNPSYGCFPSQELLAHECELSRSTLNVHLKTLEQAGLIERVQSRCEQTRKQLATRYVLAFEKAGDQPQDVVDPCPNSGHGIAPKAVSENEQKPCPETADSRVRNPDTNPVREPVSETSNERESAALGSDEGKGKTTSGDLSQDDTNLEDDPSKAEFEKRVQCFCSGKRYSAGAWPNWDNATLQYHIREFAKLSIEDRRKAEIWRDAYLLDKKAKGEKVRISPGNFFRDRMWEALDETILERAVKTKEIADSKARGEKPKGWANAWGPAFMAMYFFSLFSGRQDGREGSDAGVPVMPVHIRAAYPVVASLKTHADQNGGVVLAERWHLLKDHLEWVKKSDGFEVWQKEFVKREWVWPLHFNSADGAYLPKGGPAGLDDFKQAMGMNDDAR